MNQRGHIALYLLFSLAAATAAGYGVYTVMRGRSKAEAAEAEVRLSTANAHLPREVPERAPEPEATPAAVAPSIATTTFEAVPPDNAEAADKDTVVHGHPGVSGALDADQIERMIKRYSGRYDRCMRHAREKNQQRRGDMRLTFMIATNGAVETATATSTVDTELATCVVDVIKRLRFDKPSDGVPALVTHIMVFVPARAESDPLGQ